MLKQVLAAWVQPDRLTTVVLPPKDAKMPDMQAILDKEWKSGPSFRSEDGGSRQDRGHRSRQGPYRGAHPGQDPAYVSANLTYSGGDALLKLPNRASQRSSPTC